jgi:hypothetical protein
MNFNSDLHQAWTLLPAVGGKTDVEGLSLHSYPIGWFARGNLGMERIVLSQSSANKK